MGGIERQKRDKYILSMLKIGGTCCEEKNSITNDGVGYGFIFFADWLCPGGCGGNFDTDCAQGRRVCG
jgi:hypothetical protein